MTTGRRVAVVTGAARGIGAATVRVLADQGWSVLAVDRARDDPAVPYPLGTAAELEAVVAGAGATARIAGYAADVRSVADFRRKRGLRVGLIRSFRYGDQANLFVDALESQERTTYAGSLDPLYTILLDDGIQAMIIEPFDFPVIAGAQLKAQTSILEFGDAPVPHGLVMSKKSLAPAQQAAWREVIQSMRADGTILRIFEKYFPADLARQMTQF